MSVYRDRTYCREHCRGFQETGGLCFADGECNEYTKHTQKKMKTTKKFDDLKERINDYNFMQQTAEEYRDAIDRIEKEEKWFDICAIEYFNRDDKARKIEIDFSLAPMNPSFIKAGLQDALSKLEHKMAQEEIELKEWIEP